MKTKPLFVFASWISGAVLALMLCPGLAWSQAPEIAVPPAGQTLPAGSNATFSVVVTNVPVVGYQWRFNTTNLLASGTNAVLVLTNIQPGNAGDYDVVVTNSSGAVTSAVATLTVVLPPSIVLPPQSIAVRTGASASFTITAAGTAPLAYQWIGNSGPLVDGLRMSGSTGSNLVIANVQSGDAGSYSVAITNAWGSVTSTPVSLTIDDLGPTVLSTSPANGATNVAVYTPLVVTFSEPMDPTTINANTFYVRPGTNNLVSGAIYYDAPTRRATFTPASPLAYRTVYTATLTAGATDLAGNPVGAVRWTFTTAGLYEPDMGPVILGATDDGSTAQINLPFYVSVFGRTYNSFWINNNGNVTFTGLQSDYTAYAFPNNLGRVIIAPFFADVDTRGSGSGYVHYNNLTNRVVITWDQVGYYSMHATQRNTFQLVITATNELGNLFGFSYDDLQWTTGDFSSGSGGFGGDVARAGFDAGDNTNAVVLWQGNSAASLSSIAHSTFWFTSFGGSPHPNQPPVANAGANQGVEQATPAGTQVTLDGTLSSDDGLIRPLSFTWLEGVVNLGNGSRLNYTFPWGVHNVTLVVDDGQYQTNATVVITVRDTTPPDTVITGGPAEGSLMASRSAAVSWSGSDNGTYPSNLVYSYSIDGGPASGFATNTSAVFTGLADGPHQVSVQAQDLRGNVDATPAVRTFSVDATPPVVSNVQTTPALLQCLVTWTSGEAGTSQVEYGLTAAYGSLTALDSSLVTSHSVSVAGLRPNTPFHFRIHCQDALGNEAITADAVFTTLPDTTPPETSLTAGPSENGTVCSLPVTFGWSGSDNVTLPTNLLFSYQMDSGAWVDYTNLTSTSFASLTEGQHTFQVKARDEAGNVDPTPAIRHFVVNALAPVISGVGNSPTNIRCVIFWATDEAASSQVEYGLTAAYGSLTALDSSLVTSHSVTVSGLTPNTPYHFRVRTSDVCSHESLSGDSSFTTLPDVLPPDTFFTSGPSENGNACSLPVAFGWSGSDDVSVATNLLFSYQVDGGTWSAYTSGASTSLSGLAEGQHTLQVRAQDQAGNVDPTPAVRHFVVNTLAPVISAVGNSPTNNRCFISWTTDEPASSQVEYGLTAAYGSLTTLNSSLVTSHSVTVSGLTPNTPYHFRVRSSDVCSHESLSGDSSFTTLPDVLPPDTFFASGPSENGTACSLPVALGWSGSDDVSAAANLLFSYQVDGGAWSAYAGGVSVSLSGLAEGQHTVQVRAQDQAGNVDPTPAVRHFKVNSLPPVISLINATPGQGSCLVTWRTDEPSDSKVEYGPTSAYGQSSALNSQPVTNHAVSISGLMAVSNYHYRVISQDVCGHQTVSGDGQFTTPPAPDLQVASVAIPLEAWSGSGFDVSWVITNTGLSAATGPWVDRIYLSADKQLQTGTDQLLGEFSYDGNLEASASVLRVQTVTIDRTGLSNGTYYVLVQLDANNDVFEGLAETNNLGVSSNLTVHLTPLPDLVVTSVQAPTNGVGAQTVVVSWIVCNQGPGATDVPVWYDHLYLSPTTNKADAIRDYGLAANPTYLGSGDCYNQSMSVELPVGAGGLHYLILETDATGLVREENEANNLGHTLVPIDIQYVHPGFLHVESVQVAPAPPTTVWAGSQVTVTWVVRNTGESSVTGTWDDEVTLSPTPTYDNVHGYWDVIHHIYFSGPLVPGATYSHTATFTVPQSITAGRWYAVPNVDTHFFAGGTGGIGTGNIGRDQNSAAIDVGLPPPADLEVMTVVAPTNGGIGLPLTVSWTVANNGNNQTPVSYWYDGVYLSTNQVFDTGASRFVGTVGHWGVLDPSGSYAQTLTATIPSDLLPTNQDLATYYVFVFADSGNLVPEGVWETNNVLRATHATVIQKLPPAPPADLAVTTVAAPSLMVGGRAANISWTVENQGVGASSASSWMDNVYLSTDATYQPGQDILIGSVRHDGVLAAGASYSQTQPISLPNCTFGTFYVIVVTDSGQQVNEGGALANNVRAADKSMLIVPAKLARLEVTAVGLPASVSAGASLTFSYTVANVTGVSTSNLLWQDAVYLCPSPQFSPVSASLLGLYAHANGLAGNATYTAAQSSLVPRCFSGPYYVHVFTDISNVVNGLSCDTNNWRCSDTAVTVVPSGYASLQVARVVVPPAADSGVSWGMQWTVTNAGPGAAAGSWKDAVYASTSPVLGSNALLLGQFTYSNGLASAGTYVQSASVALPACIADQFYIFVVADVENRVNSSACQVNNQARSADPVVVNYGLHPDLAVASMDLPATSLAGQPLAVSWTVTNLGLGAAAGPWVDQLYLTPGVTFDPIHSIFLGAYTNTSPLPVGASSTQTLSPMVPDTIYGTYYLAIMTDSGNSVQECSGENNNTTVSLAPIEIPLTIYPDLVIAGVQAPGSAYSGQNINVTWVVRNGGTGPTRGTMWYDALYLSKDQVFDPTDLRLGTFPRPTSLGVGQSYTNVATVSIPPNASGPYYLIAVADSGNNLFEYIGENNNVGWNPSALVVTMPAPSDLVVTNVTITPATGLPGSQATITWSVVNASANAAQGTWTDALYLSSGNVWQAGAIPITRVDHSGLAAGAAYTGSWSGALPALTPGVYYALARTDVRNTVREANENNNTAASVGTLTMDVPVLVLGQAVSNALSTGAAHYYKVNLPAGETVRIALDSASTLSANELYVRYGGVPDLGNYDFIYNNILGSDQQIDLPTTQAGWYYILVRGAKVPDAPAPYALRADIVPFAISSVSPSHAGDNGPVTLTLKGAKFQSGAGVSLTANGASYQPSLVTVVDATTVKARFLFANAAHGTYDVVLTNPDHQSTTATQAVSIELAQPLTAQVINGLVNWVPRVGLPFKWEGSVVNAGNVDISYLTVAVQTEPVFPVALYPPERAVLVGTNSPNVSIFVARDVPPGGALDFSFVVSGFGAQAFYYYVQPKVQSKQDYLALIANQAEAVREYALTTPDAFTFTTTNASGVITTNPATFSAEMLAALSSTNLWALYFAQNLVTAGLLDPGDLASLPIPTSASFSGGSSSLETKGVLSCPAQCAVIWGVGCQAGAAATALGCLGSSLGIAAPICIAIQVAVSAACLAQLDKCLDTCDPPPPPCTGSPTRNAKGPLVYAKGFVKDDPGANPNPCCPKKPQDPNEKQGPVGYSEARFAGVQEPWPYTIYFENTSNAAAYARQVSIKDPLDPSMDIRTFRLQEIAFGDVVVKVPTNRSFFQTRVALPPPHATNIVADLSAGVDLQSNIVFWTMNAIDLNTGELVASTDEGLLPPNTTNHIGEGHVIYTIKPKAGVATGTVVTNKAEIVFDTNEPIDTNPTTNTVDALPPTSTVGVPASVVVDTNFTVTWFGTDDAGGSGVQNYDVYVSDNGGPWIMWLGATAQNSATYSGRPGHTYFFYSQARDNAANLEPAPAHYEASVLVSTNRAPTLAPLADHNVHVGSLLSLTNQATDPDGAPSSLRYSLVDAPVGATLQSASGRLTWRPLPWQAGTTNVITVAVQDSGLPPLSVSQSFLVIVDDYAQFSFGGISMAVGQQGCLPFHMQTTVPLTNVTFTVVVPPERFSSIWAQSLAPELAPAQVTMVDSSHVRITLACQAGLSLKGLGDVAQVCFQTVTNRPSGIVTVNVPISDLVPMKLDGTPLTDFSGTAGEIIIVSDTAVLGGIATVGHQVQLAVYGLAGMTYDVQTSTTLAGPWLTVGTVTCTATAQAVTWTDQMQDAVRFYRLRQH